VSRTDGRADAHATFAAAVMTGSGFARPALTAAALCVVLAMRVFVGFTPVRLKVVETAIPAVAGSVHIDARGLPRIERLVAPFAVIARIRTETAASDLFTIRVDGRTVCTSPVASGAARRIDCAMSSGWQPDARHSIDITGPSSAWTLDYLELATHHGATRAFDLLFVPAAFARYTSPHVAWIVLAALAIVMILAGAPRLEMPRWLRVLHRTLSALVAALLALSVLSPYCSPYLLLLSRSAFIRSAVVLLFPELWSIVRWLHRGETLWARRLACLAVAAAVLLAFGSIVSLRLRDSYSGNYSGFLQLSRDRFDSNPLVNGRDDVRHSLLLQENGGYDAQFMYFATYDPFLRRFRDHPATYGEFIDTPPYRFGRIGFSVLTKIASGDRWERYPVTMIALILGALFTCALLLGIAARDAGESPWWGALALLIPGFWQSVQVALPEPIAAAFALGGYLCAVRSRWLWAGIVFALSLLIRETGAILVIAVAGAAFLEGKKREAFFLVAISLLPLFAWKLYVTATLYPDWGMRSLFYNPDNFGAPFVGLAQLWAELRGGRYYPPFPDIARAATWFPLLLLYASALAVWLMAETRSAAAAAAILFAVLGLSLKYTMVWVHVGNAQRVTFELFTMLALLSIPMRRYSRALRTSLVVLWAASAIYTFWLAHDAENVREALISLVM
jgi:hypothetical protein